MPRHGLVSVPRLRAEIAWPTAHEVPTCNPHRSTHMHAYHHDGHTPAVGPDTRVAPGTVLVGDVTIGARCSIGYNVIVTAESGPVRIGDDVIVMDGSVIRGVVGNPVHIGDRTLIGPRTSLAGCQIGKEVFIATGASVFNGAVIGDGSEVRINGVVHIRTELEPGSTVPIGWIAVGQPARMFPPDHHDDIWDVQKTLDFPQYVFATRRPKGEATLLATVAPRYSAALRRLHRNDRRVELGSQSSASS